MTAPGTPEALPPGTGTGVTERRIQVAAISAALVCMLPVFLTGALAVQIGRDIEFGPSRLGIASGGFFATAAVTSALMGHLAERFGPGRAMRMATISAAVFLALASMVPSYLALFAVLTVAGGANSLSQVGANLLVAKGVAPERQGWSLALKQAGVPAGALVGGLAVPAVALTIGWRWAYVISAVAALGAALLVPVGAVPAGGRKPQRREGDVPLGPLIVLGAAAGLAAASAGTLASFLVSAGVDAGLSESMSGLMLTAGSAAGITMRLVSGAMADRRGGRHLPVVALLLLGGSAGYLALAPGLVATHVIGTAVAFGAGWAWPGLFNLAVVRLNPGAPAAATGITQTGVYIGALSGPVVFGLIVDATGYGWAWVFSAALSTAAAAGVVIGRRRVMLWRQTHIAVLAPESDNAGAPLGARTDR